MENFRLNRGHLRKKKKKKLDVWSFWGKCVGPRRTFDHLLVVQTNDGLKKKKKSWKNKMVRILVFACENEDKRLFVLEIQPT